jgi:hypothetical protein
VEQEHHSCGKSFESVKVYLFREDLNWYREPIGVSMTTSMLGVAEAEFSPSRLVSGVHSSGFPIRMPMENGVRNQ